MITKHTFVSLLDAGEILPFVLNEGDGIGETLKDRERVKKEIERFVKILQRRFGEKIYHLGSEIIEGKSYQEFMFHGSGFLEISGQPPVAINAHFHDKERARKFANALKSSIRQIVQPSRKLELLLTSLDINDKHETGIEFQRWAAMNKVRGILHKSVTFVFVSAFILAIFEAGEEISGETFGEFFGLQHGVGHLASLVGMAVAIGFCSKSVEHVVERLISKHFFSKD